MEVDVEAMPEAVLDGEIDVALGLAQAETAQCGLALLAAGSALGRDDWAQAAQKAAADSPYRDWPESERVVCNLHRAYAETTDYDAGHPLNIPHLWSEMEALHGGPIVSHA